MLELAAALITALLTWQGITRLLARGVVLGGRRAQRKESERKGLSRGSSEEHQRASRRRQDGERAREQQHTKQRRRELERERETLRRQQRQRERGAKQSEGNDWWDVLE